MKQYHGANQFAKATSASSHMKIFPVLCFGLVVATLIPVVTSCGRETSSSTSKPADPDASGYVPPASAPAGTVTPSNNAPASKLPASFPLGYTAFAIGEGTVYEGTNILYYNFVVQMVQQGCTIWSDAGPWKFGELSPKTASASVLLPDGRQLYWKCQTPDERTFTNIEICGKDYLLTNGGLFLVSGRAGKTQVVQIKSPSYKVLLLEPLAKDFPAVANFLAGKSFAPTALTNQQPGIDTPR